MTIKLNLDGTEAAKLLLRNRAAAELWRRGEFAPLLLKGPQLEMLEAFDKSDNIMFFFLCSRRIGKSVTLLTAAIRQCLKQPNSRVLYLSTTTEQTAEIVDQTVDVVLEHCPPELRPKHKVKDNKYVFPNGSEIRFKGLDKVTHNAIRGVKAHLTILDEACFVRDLKPIVDNAVMPMAISCGGRILFGSTPPETPAHDSVAIIQRCEKKGAVIIRDIYSMRGILYTESQIAQFEEESGGRESTVFKREYLAQIIPELDLAIVPAATPEKLAKITKTVPMPKGYWPDCYVGIDFGTKDLTVALFGFWDYENARLVIQDEMVLGDKRATTENIANGIRETEKRIWNGRAPLKRYSDNEPFLLRDLAKLHNLEVRVTAKDNKEAQINHLNIMLNNEQIVIDPKCKTLILHLRYGIWDKQRKSFARSKELGHSDAIDALLYMLRNVKRNRNPFPSQSYSPNTHANHGWENPHQTSSWDALKSVLK
jgi:hypothetical protein